MKLSEGFSVGFRAICINKMRSLLTMLGMIVGVASVLAMIAVGDSVKLMVLEDLEKLGGANHFRLSRGDWIKKGDRWVRNRSSEYLEYEDVLAIEIECPTVIGVWPRINYYTILVLANGGAEKRTGVIGTSTFYPIGMNWHVGQGRFISEDDISNRTKACVLGLEVATELSGEKDLIGEEVKIVLDSSGEFGGWGRNRAGV